jgi:hypothetical protein
MPNLIVVNNPKYWTFEIPGVELVSANPIFPKNTTVRCARCGSLIYVNHTDTRVSVIMCLYWLLRGGINHFPI